MPFHPFQRRHQSVWVVILQIALNPLWTQPPFIKRKFHPRFKTHHLIFFHKQLNTTLHSTKTTMRFNSLIRLIPAYISVFWRIIQRRAKMLYYILLCYR
ncbi:hypothetical protein FEM08_07640 [Flavobacterium gilvum]|nr:hypothetical protein FEM08_07640 [Flavobacterium gilvum]